MEDKDEKLKTATSQSGVEGFVIKPDELKAAYQELMCVAITMARQYKKHDEMNRRDFEKLDKATIKVNKILNETGL